MNSLKEAEDLCFSGQFEKAFAIYDQMPNKEAPAESAFAAWLYFLGAGVPQDVSIGLEIMWQAARSGSPEAQFGLGRFLEELGEYDVARTLYDESMSQGYYPSQYRIGWMYLHGLGVQKDLGEAFNLFNEAQKKGSLIAKVRVARLLLKGHKGTAQRVHGAIQAI
ncbi:MAG TPA: tetratricopeptide repeat protein, partial [Mariprofundaceae bacterium]|nr:tetratricopeptide repeat protein [Mariprofundaceae bacterium]